MAGSGVTSKRIVRQLRDHSADTYSTHLKTFKVRKTDANNRTAAFKDGMAEMLHHLVAMGVVEIVEEG